MPFHLPSMLQCGTFQSSPRFLTLGAAACAINREMFWALNSRAGGQGSTWGAGGEEKRESPALSPPHPGLNMYVTAHFRSGLNICIHMLCVHVPHVWSAHICPHSKGCYGNTVSGLGGVFWGQEMSQWLALSLTSPYTTTKVLLSAARCGRLVAAQQGQSSCILGPSLIG